MNKPIIWIAFAACFLAGCGDSSGVSQSDAEKNKAAFSQDAYEQAMMKSGRADELEAEKQRAAERRAQDADQR
jgi:hypothetical protein